MTTKTPTVKMTPRNKARLKGARAAVEAYWQAKGDRCGDESNARDLIADVLLLMKLEGQDVAAAIRMLRNNYEAMIANDPEDGQ